MHQRLYRSNNERMLLGVCGGLAERLDIDPTLVRLAFVLLFFTGPGLLVYLIGALVIPRAPELGAGVRMRALAHATPRAVPRR
jgi:phage shock protein C